MADQSNDSGGESPFDTDPQDNPYSCCGQVAEASSSTQKGCSPSGCWLAVFIVIGFCLLIAILLPAVTTPREVVRRVSCNCNLKNLSLAILYYECVYGRFPPAYTVDENGRPLHSWRVLILPYLDLNNLYEELKLDEPWNSPHNLAAAERYDLSFFRCPSDLKLDKPYTSYVMIVGPDCISEGSTSAKMKDIHNTRRTILVAEIDNSDIPWYEPRDLDATTMSYKINDPEKPSISSKHRTGAQVAFVDGHVELLSKEIKPRIIRKMTRRDTVLTDKEMKELEKNK